MRNLIWASISVLVAITVSTGCARSDRRVDARTTPPSPELLPNIEESANPYPVSTGVPRKPDDPKIVFVPKFEPIEPTKEEAKALGIVEPPINFLEFYKPTPTWENTRTFPWDAARLTEIHGSGGGSATTVLIGPSASAVNDPVTLFAIVPGSLPRAVAVPSQGPRAAIGENPTAIVGYTPSDPKRAGFQPLKDK
jgi:hypothetical protein